MRNVRLAAGATALTLLTALAGSGSASAATPAVGTSQVSTTVVGATVGTAGNLLGLRVLGDDGRATTDTLVSATPEAFSRLTALSLSSALVEPLNSVVPTPPLESRTLGTGASCDDDNTLDLTTAGVPVPVATGTLTPAKLCSAVDANGARSNLNTTLADLSAVGGLLTVDSVSSTMGAGSAATSADGSRSVSVDAVTVLDLGALLQGIGLLVSDLPVGTVSDLLETLNVTVPELDPEATLEEVVVAINGALTELEGQAGTVDSLLGDLDAILAPAGIDTPSAGTTVADAQDQLNALLATVLSNAVTALDGLALLQVESVDVGVTTKAADTVANSAAGITAELGDIHVGGVVIPGVNLASAAATIADTVGDVDSLLQTALGDIAPELAGLVSVSLFDPNSGTVTSSGGYTRARAGITALTATITPPAELAAVVSGVIDELGVDEAITGAGGEVPELDETMTTLAATLDQGVDVLSQGATLKLVEVLSASDFAPATTGTGDELPRTGTDSTTLAAFASLLALLAVGIRRTVRAAERRIDR